MSQGNHTAPVIGPEMTVLEVVSTHRETEAVFQRYNTKAGECICCKALFETLRDVAHRYDLDLQGLLADLRSEAGQAR